MPNLNSEEEQSKRQASIHKIIEAVRSTKYFYTTSLVLRNNLTKGIILFVFSDIRVMVKNIPPNKEMSEVKKAFAILEKCRNQDNNPESQA